VNRRELITGASALGVYAGLQGRAEAIKFNEPQGRALLGGAGNQQPQVGGAFSLVSSVSNGAWTGYPQSVSNGQSSFICAVGNTGLQSIYQVDNTSGALVNSLQLSAQFSGTEDDHQNPAVIITPTGALLTAYCGHQVGTSMFFRRSAAGTIAGFGAEYSVSISQPTYPQLFVNAATGSIYLICRTGGNFWAIMVSTDDGLTWTVLGSFVSDSQQLYCTGYWSAPNVLRLFSNYNQTDQNSIIYIAELNVVTGALVSGSGTLCNMLTNTPAFPSTLSNWSTLVTPGTNLAAAIQSVDMNANLAFAVITDDQQYEQYWYAYYNGGGQFNSANWSLTKIVDGQYGVGDTAGPPAYRWSGRHTMSYESGLVNPRVYISRQVRGTFVMERWDAVNPQGTAWQCTMNFASLPLGLSNAIQRPQGIFGASKNLPFYFMNGTYHEFTSFSTTLNWPIITSQGNSAPALTCPTSYTTPEQIAFSISLSASQPVGWQIVGGPDAALFVCSGNQLYLQAKQFLAPIDANGDNVYQVTLQATSLSGKTSTFNFSVTITQAASAPANLLKFSQVFNNAAWTASNVTLTQNTTDLLDPLGTNLACKVAQANTGNLAFRVQQTLSLTAGQTYTLSCYFNTGTVQYCALNGFDGVTSFGGTFDIGRSNLVAPVNGLGTIVAHGIQAVANGWSRIWVTFIAGNTSASSLAQIIAKGIAGSSQSEIGVTTNTIYIFGAMLNTGALGTYAPRTT
jgi:hypothetical protein